MANRRKTEVTKQQVPIVALRPNTRSQSSTATNRIATTRSKATRPTAKVTADTAVKEPLLLPRAKSNSTTPPPPVLERRLSFSSESDDKGEGENNAGPSKPPVLVRSARLVSNRGRANENEVFDKENIASPMSTERQASEAATENIMSTEQLEEGLTWTTDEESDKEDNVQVQVRVGKGQKNGREGGGKENVLIPNRFSSIGYSNLDDITRNVKTLNMAGVSEIPNGRKSVAQTLVRNDNDSVGSEYGRSEEVVAIKRLNLLSFSFPNLTKEGDREMNVLMVGANIVEIQKGIRLNAENDKSCPGVLKMYQAPSLAESYLFTEQKNIHYILMILRKNDPLVLNRTLEELRYLDPLFVGRKRVDFIMVAKNTSSSDRTTTHSTDVSQISLNQLKAFYDTVGIAIRNIYQDEPDSVEFGTRHAYNKIKRLLIHPTLT